MRILRSSQFIAEGAGAGYKVKFEGLKFDLATAEFTGERIMIGDEEYWKIKIGIKHDFVDRWETKSYYEYMTSDGDDNFFFYDSDDDRLIEGGISFWVVSKTDFLEYVSNHYDIQVDEKLDIKPITGSWLKSTAQASAEMKKTIINYTDYLREFFDDECGDSRDLEFNYGGGWAHANLPNPIVLGGDVKDKEYPFIEYSDGYGNLYINCYELQIDCEQIVNDINYFYEYADYANGEYGTYYDEDDGMNYLQLSDEHILWNVHSKFDENEYDVLCKNALERLKNKYGVEFFMLGRSGRHVCVEDTLENRKNFGSMKSDVEDEQKELVKKLNGNS